jgi:hypothetical protein
VKKNIFQAGFTRDGAWAGPGTMVGPLSFRLTRAQIEAGGYEALKRLPVPKGWTGSYPYIVKVNSEGEYIVNADGTAQWLDYHSGHVGEPMFI